jgi:hypothetical protein
MSRTPEHTTPEDSSLIPIDRDAIERSLVFGAKLQEYADMLDAFFPPDVVTDHRQVPFGQLGDGSLTIVSKQEGKVTSMLSLGYHAPADDMREGFYATKASSADTWVGNGKEQHPDWRIARMLDANWPSLLLDNTLIRTIVARPKNTITFEDIREALDSFMSSHEPLASTKTFTHRWSWSDSDRVSLGRASVTIERDNYQPPRYTFEVDLPHEYRPNGCANTRCIAHLNEQFGVSYEVKVDEPTITRLNPNLCTIAEVMDQVLDMIIDARLSSQTDSLDIDSLRSDTED